MKPVLARHPRRARALAEAFVPTVAGLDDEALSRMLRLADGTLAQRPAALRRQVGLALNALYLLGSIRFLAPLRSVALDRRRRFLETLQDSPLRPLRLAVWGVRTLVFAGYYGDPDRHAELGYRPDPLGWAARREENEIAH